MSAYIRQDRIDHEVHERTWREDLMIERLSGEILADPIMLASSIADLDEDDKPTRRLADALHSLYHDQDSLTPAVLYLRSALYEVIKNHCEAIMEKLPC